MHGEVSCECDGGSPAATGGGLLRQAGSRRMAQLLRPLGRFLRPAVNLRAQGVALALPWPAADEMPEARQLTRGHFSLAGHDVATAGRIVFDIVEAPSAWLRRLHELGWLRALIEGEGSLARLAARAHVRDWALRLRRNRLPREAHEPVVRARRLVHLCAAAPTLLEEADDEWRVMFLAALGVEARQLFALAPGGLDAASRLEIVMAQLFAALALRGMQGQRASVSQQLCAELRAQFLADGGHVSRSPQVLLRVLAVLLPLARGLDMAGMGVPDAVRESLARGLAMLRLLRHADGGLALFHGTRAPAHGMLARVLEMDSSAAQPLSLAPHSGYARLEGGSTVVIADVGGTPPPWHNPAAALSALAFEMSSGGRRLITSCGAPWREVEELALAARFSAAHSILQVADEDAGELLEGELLRFFAGGVAAIGPAVEAGLTRARDGATRLNAAHDAWSARWGLRACRRLELDAAGARLRGEDAFVPVREDARERECLARFHLHPAVVASMARDGRSITLRLPGGEGWRMEARGCEMSLEESIFLADAAMPRRSMQIVLRTTCGPNGALMRWEITRLARARRGARARGGKGPALPLD